MRKILYIEGENMNTRDIFKKNLNRFIEQSGKSKKAISEEMNIPYTTLAEWSNGKKFPRADGIEKLANYFRILKSDLLEENENYSYISKYPSPNVIEDHTANPVIGDDEHNVLRIAGRDGRYITKKLSDSQVEMLTKLIDELPDAPDDL